MKQSPQIKESLCLHLTFKGVIPSFVNNDCITVKLAAGQHLRDTTTLMTPSGTISGVDQETHTATEEDHGSVSSCLSQLDVALR